MLGLVMLVPGAWMTALAALSIAVLQRLPACSRMLMGLDVLTGAGASVTCSVACLGLVLCAAAQARLFLHANWT